MTGVTTGAGSPSAAGKRSGCAKPVSITACPGRLQRHVDVDGDGRLYHVDPFCPEDRRLVLEPERCRVNIAEVPGQVTRERRRHHRRRRDPRPAAAPRHRPLSAATSRCVSRSRSARLAFASDTVADSASIYPSPSTHASVRAHPVGWLPQRRQKSRQKIGHNRSRASKRRTAVRETRS